jgi:hypothetical protein
LLHFMAGHSLLQLPMRAGACLAGGGDGHRIDGAAVVHAQRALDRAGAQAASMIGTISPVATIVMAMAIPASCSS